MSSSTSPAIVRPSCLPFTINDYNFVGFIGKGGFAEVYLVRSIKFSEDFVAKVMTIDPSEKDQMWKIFDAECSALSELNHPHIIRLYDRFNFGSQFFLILEYCPCGSLHDEITEYGVFSLERFTQVGGQLVSALQYCHSRGVSHRDIKPGNVLFDINHRVKLADFGLSLHTKDGELCKAFSGSSIFTAPEIFLRKPNDPMMGDVWALGIVFSIMATGSPPWNCDSLGALRQLAKTGQYTLKKGVPPVIEEIISKMIVVDPSARITMAELAEHPLFKTRAQRVSLNAIRSIPSTKSQWDLIPRAAPNSEIIAEQWPPEEAAPLCKLSALHTASSQFLHRIPEKKKVRRMVSKLRPAGTFAECEDTVTEIGLK